jgi:hypothetical protein
MEVSGQIHASTVLQQEKEFVVSIEYEPQCGRRGGVRGGAVGWGTALQDVRSRVLFPMESLEFFSELILLLALWSWGRLSL